MDRPKRETKAADRLIANPNFGSQGKPDKSEKEIVKPTNKRPARKQPQKPEEAPKSPIKSSSKTPSAPTKTKNRRQNIKFRFARK